MVTTDVAARTTGVLVRFWRRLRQSLPWYIFILVNLVVFVIFNFVPWLSMFELSLYDTDLLSRKVFVGLGNIGRMAQDKILHRALLNSAQYAVMYVPLVVILSLSVAILVNRKMLGMKTFRAFFFLPNVTSIAVLALIYRWFLSPRPNGPVNYILGILGIPPQKFLIDVHQALPSIAVIGLWSSFGYYMVIWLAGLQSVPRELYDAALVDGATEWKRHWYVTLPLLRPTAAFIIVVATIGALQEFGSIFILTGGGPVYATSTIVYHIYVQAFNFGRFGYASAVSVLLFAFILSVVRPGGRQNPAPRSWRCLRRACHPAEP